MLCNLSEKKKGPHNQDPRRTTRKHGFCDDQHSSHKCEKSLHLTICDEISASQLSSPIQRHR